MNEFLPYIFLLIGLIVLAITFFYKSNKSELKKTGIAVDGIVFDQEMSSSGSFDNSTTGQNDKITVRFVTQKQEWITGQIQQDFQIYYSGQYKNGETLKVYYDEKNPSNFYVDTKQSELKGRVVIAIVGFVFLLIGLYKIIV